MVDETLARMIVFVEDKRFYSHYGVDPIAIVRAFIANTRAKRYIQGASTITQQLARTLYLSNEKTLTRKVKEVLKAFSIERSMSKDEILYSYVSNVYMGQREDGSVIKGFEEAAKHYFGKTLEETTPVEEVSLVAMLKGPNFYRPDSTAGIMRTTHLFLRMTKHNII